MDAPRIIWTVLPNGIDLTARKLKLSVFISPRLNFLDASSLGSRSIPYWLRWPEKLNTLSFSVEIQDGSGDRTFSAKKVDPDPATLGPPYPDLALWQEMFKAETSIRPFVIENYKDRIIRSFPVREVISYLKEVYEEIAQDSPNELPKLPILGNKAINHKLSELITDLGSILKTHQPFQVGHLPPDLRKKREEWLTNTLKQKQVKAVDPNTSLAGLEKASGFSSKTQLNFFQADRFYSRPENQDPYLERPDINKVLPPLPQPEIDFHEMLTALGDYPELMRKLGLVVDLEVEIPEKETLSAMIRASASSEPIIHLKPWNPNPLSPFRNHFPWTRYILTERLFIARPRPNSEISNGMLKLNGSNDEYNDKNRGFDLTQVDVDGAMLKVINFAGTLQRLKNADSAPSGASPRGIPYDTPDEAGLPALRSAGIALVKYGRAFRLAEYFSEVFKRNADLDLEDPKLYADDLARGYRVEIWDEPPKQLGRWRSLCERVGAYYFPASGRRLEISDEGYAKGASTTSADNDESDLYLHETMFRWDGWSLCAPHPGKTVRPKRDGLRQAEVVEPVQNKAGRGIQMEVSFRAKPGSLPRLRFGRSYRLRVRVVDLAGNSIIPRDKTDPALVSDELFYARYEPVPPPTLVPRSAMKEGESVERMVIRSNYDKNTAEYAESPEVKHHSYKPWDERHVVPPKTSQLMAETHGNFDESFGKGKDSKVHDRWFNIAKREEGTLFDRQIVDIVTGAKKDLPDPLAVELVTPPGTTLPVTLPLKPPDEKNPTGDRLAPGQYLIHKEARLILPYLPDVFARGAAMRGLPGADVHLVELEPLSDPRVVRVNPGDGVFVIKVPFHGKWPDTQPFRIRLLERPGRIEKDRCEEIPLAPANPPIWDPRERILTVFLPKAEVVRVRYSCYLDNNDLDQMGICKWLIGSAKLDALKKFALCGSHWMITPFRELTLVHAVQQPLCAPSIEGLNAKRKLGDTYADLEGMIYLSVKSTAKIDILAKWKEPIDDLTEPKWKWADEEAHACTLNIEKYYKDRQPIPVRPHEVQHEFGDTKHRVVFYQPRGATRFREYFLAEITKDQTKISRTGPFFKVSVPSSARPAAPNVLYVVPTYKWNPPKPTKMTGSRMKSERLGRGLRVYLERPWFSSGEGELLGVVYRDPDPHRDPNAWPTLNDLKPYVTQIGNDPLWKSASRPAELKPDDFINATATRSGLSLDELQRPGEPFPFSVVSVAGYEVEYDEKRHLWYCDIEMDSGASYYPFVRLALARYQPDSIPGAELSRIKLTDFAQLAPDRTVSINLSANKKVLTINIFGITPSETGVSKTIKENDIPITPLPHRVGSDPTGSNEFVVTVEKQSEEVDTDLGWVREADAIVERTLPAAPIEKHLVWSSKITLPQTVGAKKYRLVVKEFEAYYEDVIATSHGMPDKSVDWRLVYADVIEL